MTDQDKADIARAFQDAVVETIVIKCERAILETGYANLVMAGGVSANLNSGEHSKFLANNTT